MARVKNGLLGEIEGKLGPIVGVNWMGKTYLRTAPGFRTKKRGEREKANQTDFSKLHFWLRPILKFLRAGFKGYPGRVHAFNAAKSLALKNAFVGKIGNRVFDPALVQVSWGDLALPSNISVTKSNDFELTFHWNVSTNYENSHEKDQVMMLVYNEAIKMASYELTGQFRRDGSDKLTIEEEMAGNCHVYIAFVSHDRSRQSPSQYLGVIEMGKSDK